MGSRWGVSGESVATAVAVLAALVADAVQYRTDDCKVLWSDKKFVF